MKTTRLLILALAACAAGRLSAQDPTPPPAAEKPAEAPAAPKTEMQKWIETTDAQWQEAFKKGVTAVHEADINKVKVQYVASLEDGIKKASAASDLKGAVALRDEQKRFGETLFIPEQDEAADAASVKQIRAVIRAQLAKVNSDQAARAKALHAKYDALLAQTQAQLTKAQRLDDALLVQAKREEVAASWVTPEVKAVLEKVGADAPKPPEVPAKPLARVPNTQTSVAQDEKNLFTNANFEKGLDGWEVTSWAKNGGTATVDTKELHNGKPTLRIDNPKGDFTFVRQRVGKPHTRYRLTGYIKTQSVEPVDKRGKDGAALAVGFTADVKGGKSVPIQKTQSWTKVSVDFGTVDKTEIRIGAGLGFYNSFVSGTAWFSDLTLIEVGQNAVGKRTK